MIQQSNWEATSTVKQRGAFLSAHPPEGIGSHRKADDSVSSAPMPAASPPAKQSRNWSFSTPGTGGLAPMSTLGENLRSGHRAHELVSAARGAYAPASSQRAAPLPHNRDCRGLGSEQQLPRLEVRSPAQGSMERQLSRLQVVPRTRIRLPLCDDVRQHVLDDLADRRVP